MSQGMRLEGEAARKMADQVQREKAEQLGEEATAGEPEVITESYSWLEWGGDEAHGARDRRASELARMGYVVRTEHELEHLGENRWDRHSTLRAVKWPEPARIKPTDDAEAGSEG